MRKPESDGFLTEEHEEHVGTDDGVSRVSISGILVPYCLILSRALVDLFCLLVVWLFLAQGDGPLSNGSSLRY